MTEKCLTQLQLLEILKDYEVELIGVQIECDIEIEINNKKIELNGARIECDIKPIIN
ncbi:MAG: hypothetical protein PQ964_04785 [Methanobacteriaceae archaeon]|jgi:CO dehydrogenase/acetyl-CoA synthase delta subunit